MANGAYPPSFSGDFGVGTNRHFFPDLARQIGFYIRFIRAIFRHQNMKKAPGVVATRGAV